jgi:dienelactone hydrolase
MNKHKHKLITLFLLAVGINLTGARAEDSFPPLVNGNIPTNVSELWGTYDPRKEPIETEVAKEWKEGDITLRVVLYTIGTFKGQKSKMAAIYAFPKSDKKLPAIIDVHGGGGSASIAVVREMAQNGYAGLSINWGGNKFDTRSGELDILLAGAPNTDWGAVNGTQTCKESPKDNPKAFDSIESPRNSIWFLLFIGTRRGLTFLEQQPEVDPERLGIRGHSMGGKVTVDVAGIDKRVKAAVPSCGGAGNIVGKLSGMPGAGVKSGQPNMIEKTIDDEAYIPLITCPIMYKSASNDFAGPFDNMTVNFRKLTTKHVGYSISPHMNHTSLPESEVSHWLWFEAYLKKSFNFPSTPELAVNLETSTGIPRATLKPERLDEVAKVEIFYSIDPHPKTRFWRDTQAKQNGKEWIADCPIMSTDHPLFFFANVYYKVPANRAAEGSIKPSELYLVSSKQLIYIPQDLKDAGVKATDKPSRLIEDFSRGWHDWIYSPTSAMTSKIRDPKWSAPEGAKLVVDVKCEKDNPFILSAVLNNWGDVQPGKPVLFYAAGKYLKGSPDWQTVTFSPEEMMPCRNDNDHKDPMNSWNTVTQITFKRVENFYQEDKQVQFGATPETAPGRDEPIVLRNLRWEGGVERTDLTAPVSMTETEPKDLHKVIQQEIKKSLDPEKK